MQNFKKLNVIKKSKNKQTKENRNNCSQKVFFFVFACMFALILNRIINFWPFDKNESLYLASLKLDYKQTVPDQRDSKEGIVIRGSCSALYQNFRLH